MRAWNAGVKVADAACSTKISRKICQTSVTKGSETATPARTPSALTSSGVRGRRLVIAALSGATTTYATILRVRAIPSTRPASPPARSKASRPSATVSSPVPTSATACAANSVR